jgi:hypothetical protein
VWLNFQLVFRVKRQKRHWGIKTLWRLIKRRERRKCDLELRRNVLISMVTLVSYFTRSTDHYRSFRSLHFAAYFPSYLHYNIFFFNFKYNLIVKVVMQKKITVIFCCMMYVAIYYWLFIADFKMNSWWNTQLSAVENPKWNVIFMNYLRTMFPNRGAAKRCLGCRKFWFHCRFINILLHRVPQIVISNHVRVLPNFSKPFRVPWSKKGRKILPWNICCSCVDSNLLPLDCIFYSAFKDIAQCAKNESASESLLFDICHLRCLQFLIPSHWQ